MTDETNPPSETEPAPEPAPGTPAEPAADQSSDWDPAGESRGTQAREWLAQLQQMIDRVTAEAAPVARDVAVKAAELAAVAGEKAGPLARRAAEVTGDVGTKVAERSRRFADDVRSRGAEDGPPAPDAPDVAGEPVTDEPPADPPAGPPETAQA